ncbi:helix-turn-helix domain-containing protein [Hymenobacter terricola]|uniref:helix-turn-helix domain-containing protein n=1 Tax=Hymenobacter terricola TaxID=2819236 RepID=UPI001B303DE5|nr:AraC family transcriptional regulator [Hymenobacter terricola]
MATAPFAPTPVVLHSCYIAVQRPTEFFVDEHVLMHILSGSFVIFVAGAEQTYRSGDTILLTRHQLMKGTKYPEPGGEFNSVSLVLDQATLRGLHHLAPGPIVRPQLPQPVVALPRHPLFGDLARSIIAYNAGQAIPQLPALKAQEAVVLLLHLQPELRHVLFDFSEPGKLDLAQYMAQHFSFNLGLKQFAYLTGRSLATFKRDFVKLFHVSPSRWLQQKRLEEAHYLLQAKKRKPSDVYLEVGFENLSHFSTAFKKQFGFNPSQVQGSVA